MEIGFQGIGNPVLAWRGPGCSGQRWHRRSGLGARAVGTSRDLDFAAEGISLGLEPIPGQPGVQKLHFQPPNLPLRHPRQKTDPSGLPTPRH